MPSALVLTESPAVGISLPTELEGTTATLAWWAWSGGPSQGRVPTGIGMESKVFIMVGPDPGGTW